MRETNQEYINRILIEITPHHGAKFDRIWNVIDQFPTIRDGNPFKANEKEAYACARMVNAALSNRRNA